MVGGAGPIGLLLAAVLKAKGIKVIITELSKARKDKARESGVADYILDPSEVDVVEEVKKLTNGEGVDVAFECTSVNKVLDTMVEACRPTAKSRHRIHLEPPRHHQRPQCRDERAGRARHHRLLQRPRRNHQTGGRRQNQPRTFHHPAHQAGRAGFRRLRASDSQQRIRRQNHRQSEPVNA